jgi:hypothetical protein
MEALDAIHDRLESPADRMLRNVAPLSSYFVLPVFALANAGVTVGSESFNGRGLLMTSIVAGLTAGKPLGFALASALAVGLNLAEGPGTPGVNSRVLGHWPVSASRCRSSLQDKRYRTPRISPPPRLQFSRRPYCRPY